jgi:glutamine amidotransferase
MPAVGKSMNVVVADTGLGNIKSVVRALDRAGARAVVSNDPDTVAKGDAVVVPGQGAFGDCSRALDHGLGDAIRQSIARGVPYLGICLGLQVLFDSSEEAPGCAGLGVFGGHVARLPNAAGIKIPHVGWNLAEPVRDSWLVHEPEHFYFVHGYVVIPRDASLACAMTEHGARFVSAIEKDNVAAVQFHPEKSQRAGLALLERFLQRGG